MSVRSASSMALRPMLSLNLSVDGEMCASVLQVKQHVQRAWHDLLTQDVKVNLSDYILAKEVRMGEYSSNRTLPLGAIVAERNMEIDPRAAPLYKQRVPYVVVAGPRNSRLGELVISPHMLLNQSTKSRLNVVYYIEKQMIPALRRVFTLVGADVDAWFRDMPKSHRQADPPPTLAYKWIYGDAGSSTSSTHHHTIDSHFSSLHCIVCSALGLRNGQVVCHNCQTQPQAVHAILAEWIRHWECNEQRLRTVCFHCTGGADVDRCDSPWCFRLFLRPSEHAPCPCCDAREYRRCDSLDCPIFFSRKRCSIMIR
jgi:DNA polymerase zeta